MDNQQQSKAFPVSWDQFHRDCRALSWRLADKGEFTAIVAITRGGLVPAGIIARELGVRTIETVCIASYHDYDDQGELKVIKPIDPKVIGSEGGEGILIIDDLSTPVRQQKLFAKCCQKHILQPYTPSQWAAIWLIPL